MLPYADASADVCCIDRAPGEPCSRHTSARRATPRTMRTLDIKQHEDARYIAVCGHTCSSMTCYMCPDTAICVLIPARRATPTCRRNLCGHIYSSRGRGHKYSSSSMRWGTHILVCSSHTCPSSKANLLYIPAICVLILLHVSSYLPVEQCQPAIYNGCVLILLYVYSYLPVEQSQLAVRIHADTYIVEEDTHI